MQNPDMVNLQASQQVGQRQHDVIVSACLHKSVPRTVPSSRRFDLSNATGKVEASHVLLCQVIIQLRKFAAKIQRGKGQKQDEDAVEGSALCDGTSRSRTAHVLWHRRLGPAWYRDEGAGHISGRWDLAFGVF